MVISDSNGGGKTLIISPERMFVAIFIYVIGLVLMMASDTQKILCTEDGKRIQSRQNLDQGWVVSQLSQYKNYTGEAMLYSSFAICSQSWFPWFVHSVLWGLM